MKIRFLPAIALFLFAAVSVYSQSGSLADRARQLTKEKKFGEAAELYRQAVEKDPNQAYVYTNLSWCYLELKEYDKAVETARKAIAIDPNSNVALNNLGYGLSMLGRTDEAIGYLQDSVKADGTYSKSRVNLGTALMKAGRLDEALTQYKAAVEIEPNSVGLHNNLVMNMSVRNYSTSSTAIVIAEWKSGQME